MTCLFGFTLNIVEAFETTYTMMIAFYVSHSLYPYRKWSPLQGSEH